MTRRVCHIRCGFEISITFFNNVSSELEVFIIRVATYRTAVGGSVVSSCLEFGSQEAIDGTNH